MDILDKVLLSESAVLRWQAKVVPVIKHLIEANVNTNLIPDECAEENDKGELILYIDLPDGGRLKEVIAPSEWAWVDQRD